MFLLAVTGRGLIELAVPKSTAYALQVGAIVIFMGALLLGGRLKSRERAGRLAWAASLFALSVLTSTFLSAVLNNIDYGLPLMGVMLFLSVVLVFFAAWTFEARTRIAVGPAFATVVVAQVAVGFAQQFFGLASLGGVDRGTFGSVARPSGLTGSFLHYPLVLGIAVFVLAGLFAASRRRLYLLVAILALGALLMSYSRSGLVLAVVGLAYVVFMSRSVGAWLKFGFVAIGVFVIAIATSSIDGILDRFLSIFDLAGAGNVERVYRWGLVIDEWQTTPLIFGTHVGQYSNVTGNLSSATSTVAESGVLQQLISFGLIGLVSYYFLLVAVIRQTVPTPLWFRAGLVGAIAQSAFYQSVEVLPFVVLFALVPFIADGVDSHAFSARGPSASRHRRLDRREAVA